MFSFPLLASLLSCLSTAVAAPARRAVGDPPGALVSAQWLSHNFNYTNLVVLDVRAESDYNLLHVPDSVSVPFGMESAWSVVGEDGLLLQMPPADSLFSTLAAAGVSNPEPETNVVLVTASVPGLLEAGPRVVATLQVAGLGAGRVGILNGGFSAWTASDYPVSTVAASPEPGIYSAEPDSSFIVDIDYVAASLERDDTILIDARAPELYSGEIEDPKAEPGTRGHIPGAYSLPFSLVWNDDGTYRTRHELMGFVTDELGTNLALEMRTGGGEVIVYCSTGGKASAWFFVLSRMLGFGDVKLYDGSVQDWSRYYELEM